MSTGKVIPAVKCQSYTPNDNTVFSTPTRGILIQDTGPVAVLLEDDSAPVTIPALAGGIIHPLACKKVLDAGTTATTVILFW